MDFAPLLELFPNLPPSLVQTTLHLHAGDVDAAVAELLQAGPPSRKRRRRDDPAATLAAMGFTAEEAQTALHNCGSLEAAVAVLLGGEPGMAGGAQGEAEVMDVDAAEARLPMHNQLLAAPPAPASRSGKRKQARAAQGTAQATPQHNGLPSTGISSAASSSSSSFSSVPQPRARLPSEEQLLLVVQRYSDAAAELAKDPTKPKVAPCRIAPEDQTLLVAVYDEMIDRFNCREYHQRYGYHPSENVYLGIQAGQPVPPYFANVQHGSIFSRKLLSMQGLRNLVLHGPTIFQELRGQLFASDPTRYPANTGLHKMRYYTGNTVDLDTVVLRCNDPAALKLINELNRADGRPEHGSPQEFAQSQQAIEIAVETAKQLVAGFIDDFKLTKPQQKQRRVEPAQIHPSKIPIAQDNSSRGRWPLWRYINAGVDTFHANVPSMAEVTGALLKAPAAAARAYLLCRDDPERLQAFYEDGISDSCFNGKWKALEAFNDMLDKRGSINVILADLQAANQHIFTAAFFAADDDQARNEVREMVQLVGQRTGRDKEGRVRPITPDDVQRWVQDPGQPV